MADYTVDDILLEYEAKKKDPVSDDTKKATNTFRATKPRSPYTPPRSATQTFAVEDDTTTKRADGPAEPPLRPAKPKPVAETKTVTLNTRTRVLTATVNEEKYHTSEIPVQPQLEGQIVMDMFADEPVDEAALEEELRDRRREKVSGFQIVEGGKSGFKLTGEEEASAEGDPLDPQDEEEEELEDYTDYAETEAIQSELSYRQRAGALALIATAGIEALLVLMLLLVQWKWITVPMMVIGVSQAILLVGIIGINHRIISGGLKKLFTLKADAETPAAVCGIVGLLHAVYQMTLPPAQQGGFATLFACVAGLSVLSVRVAYQLQYMRISRNFRFVSNEKAIKQAAMMIKEEKDAEEIGYRVSHDGVPRVMYYRRASFLEKFLTYSYADDPADKAMRWFVPTVVLVAALCTAGYAIMFPAFLFQLPTVFTATLLVAMPSWAMFSAQRAISRTCKRALKKGAVIMGYEAAREFGGELDTVVLEASEMFRKEQVKLHGIKTFSGTRIDEAITDSAAVVIAAGAPLAPIFKRLIENRTDILREVDSLAYEQDMGLSGWVGGRRVLVGNRRLLANHGVDVPPKEYEDRYTKDGRKTVYLSTGGELSAMFVVSYLAEPNLKQNLRALVKSGVSVAVRTCDANITSALIASVMDLPQVDVTVFTAGEGRAYESIAGRDADTPATSSVACSPRAGAKVFAPLQCFRLRRGVGAGLIAQLAIACAAMLVCVFVTVMTGLVLRADAMFLLSLGTGVVSYWIPRFFRT